MCKEYLTMVGSVFSRMNGTTPSGAGLLEFEFWEKGLDLQQRIKGYRLARK
jgi:hypothetical protein